MGSASSRSSQVQALQVEPSYREMSEKAKIKSNSNKKTPGLSKKGSAKSISDQNLPDLSETAIIRSHLNRKSSKIAFETEIPMPINNNTKESSEVTTHAIKDLEKQLAESESQNLDLQDRIQFLEERIEYINTQNEVTKQHDNLTETLHAKDQYIVKIEKDQQTLQQDTNKIKLRYKKRIRQLTSQLNEAKQETSIQLFELKDEINRLTEENQRLQGLVTGPNLTESSDSLGKSDGANDMNKMTIILELSNQISEQTDKINELEKCLREKDQTIVKLKRSSSTGMNNDAFRSVGKKSHSDNVLKASYEGDRDTIQTESLRKLSTGLNHYTKTYDDRIDSSEDEELRGLSGASRDSGIGSTKKNGWHESSKKPPSRLSTLSDSDWDTDDQPPLIQSKIRSAPPEKQGKRTLSRVSSLSTKTASDGEDDVISIDDKAAVTSSGKRKKKSALKKRVGQEDEYRRTPVASVAFESKSEFPSIYNNNRKSKNSFFLTQSISPDSSNSNIPVS